MGTHNRAIPSPMLDYKEHYLPQKKKKDFKEHNKLHVNNWKSVVEYLSATRIKWSRGRILDIRVHTELKLIHEQSICACRLQRENERAQPMASDDYPYVIKFWKLWGLLIYKIWQWSPSETEIVGAKQILDHDAVNHSTWESTLLN